MQSVTQESITWEGLRNRGPSSQFLGREVTQPVRKKEGGESQKPEMVRIPRKEFLTFPRGAKGTRQRDIDKGQMQLDKVTTEISKNQIEVSAVTLKQGQINLCETES